MKTTDKVLTFCFSIGLGCLLFSLMAHGDPAPAASGVPLTVVATTVGGWTAWVNAFTTGGLVLSLASALEFMLRIIPSQKPLSIAYALDDTFKAVGSLCSSVGSALDKILPNRLSS